MCVVYLCIVVCVDKYIYVYVFTYTLKRPR